MADEDDGTVLLRAFALGFGVAGLLFAGVVGMGMADAVAENYQAATAHSTEATVVSTELSSGTARAPSGGQGRVATYGVHVTYRYTVAGRTYTNDWYRPPGVEAPRRKIPARTRGEAERIADGYSNGSTVTVYYRPGRPGRSYLTRETTGPVGFVLGAAFALVPALVGFVALVLGFGPTVAGGVYAVGIGAFVAYYARAAALPVWLQASLFVGVTGLLGGAYFHGRDPSLPGSDGDDGNDEPAHDPEAATGDAAGATDGDDRNPSDAADPDENDAADADEDDDGFSGFD